MLSSRRLARVLIGREEGLCARYSSSEGEMRGAVVLVIASAHKGQPRLVRTRANHRMTRANGGARAAAVSMPRELKHKFVSSGCTLESRNSEGGTRVAL